MSNMKTLESMIEVEALRFIEPDYASLVNNGEPAVLICEAKPEAGGARILLDEEGNPCLTVDFKNPPEYGFDSLI